jgi:hypothetical protein
MVKNGKDCLPAFIHRSGIAGQRKHDRILTQLFAGLPTDRQHLIKSLDLISKLNVADDIKSDYYDALIKYSATGDKATARLGINSKAYVQAVIAADQALKPIWKADQTLISIITQTIKTIAAQVNYLAFIVKQTITNHYKHSKSLKILITKIMPAHAPTATCGDIA